MKKRNRIQFAAVPVMIISIIVGILMLAFGEYFLVPSEIVQVQILGEIVNVIAGTIISIAALNFFLTISTEQELIDKLQTRISKDTDYSVMSDESKLCVIRSIAEQKLLENKATSDSGSKWDMKALAEDLSNNFWGNIEDTVYFETYDRKLTITLIDSGIVVKTSTRLVYNNLSNQHGKKFRLQSLFLTEEEAKSFKVLELLYNKTNKKDEYEKSRKHATVYPAKINPEYLTTTAWLLDISGVGLHEITYTTEYTTQYTQFFQTKTIEHNCKHFQLEAILVDSRTNKDVDYLLRWEIICGSSEKSRIAADKIVRGDNHHFATLGGITWFPKYGGYVLTLNSK